jgi:hypothetical protein
VAGLAAAFSAAGAAAMVAQAARIRVMIARGLLDMFRSSV